MIYSNCIGISLGAFIVVGGEVSASFNIDVFMAEILDIYNTKYESAVVWE